MHSCNSNEFVQPLESSAASYTTSLAQSTDTLWDPKQNDQANTSTPSCNRYQKPRPTSVYHQPTTQTFVSHRYVHPSQVQPMQSTMTTTHAYIQPQYVQKPKSWDNLAAKGCSGYGGFGYGYVVSGNNGNGSAQPQQPQQQQQHPPPLPLKGQHTLANLQQSRMAIPRKSSQAPYGRYSAFAEVENYVPGNLIRFSN